jgi:hypothetical protein
MVGDYDSRSVRLIYISAVHYLRILIWSRYVSIGIRGRPLTTPEPSADQLVPVDDAAWEQDVSHLFKSPKYPSAEQIAAAGPE